jgi:glycosyltransferase involved in cell wall biosynthesis
MKCLLIYVGGGGFFANAGQAEVERGLLDALARSGRYRFRVLLDGDRALADRFTKQWPGNADIDIVALDRADPTSLFDGVSATVVHSIPSSPILRWLHRHDAFFSRPTLQFVHSLPLSRADRLSWGSLWGRWKGMPSCQLVAASEVTAARARSLAFEARHFGGSLPPVAVVPYGVQLDEVQSGVRRRGRERLGCPSSALVLLSLARISPEKMDYVQLFRAFAEVVHRLASQSDVRMVIAGGVAATDRPYVERLTSLAGELGVGSRVSILAHVSAREKADLLSAADLFVSTATNPQESFGIALVEAMAAGLPILATDWNGYREVLPDAYAAHLLPTIADHDVANSLEQRLLSDAAATPLWQVVDGAERLLRDKALRERLGAIGLEYATALTWQAAAEKIIALLEHLNAGVVHDDQAAWTAFSEHGWYPRSPVDGLASGYLEGTSVLDARRAPEEATGPVPDAIYRLCAAAPAGVTVNELAAALGVTVDVARRLVLTQVRSGSVEVILRGVAADGQRDICSTGPRSSSLGMTAFPLKEHPSRPARFSAGPLLRRIEDLDDPGCVPDRAFRVETARVVVADVPLILHDFPAVAAGVESARGRAPAAASVLDDDEAVRRAVDGWLLANGALISEAQLRHEGVNTPIRTIGAPIAAHRPTRYGRALLVPVATNDGVSVREGGTAHTAALLDLKGAGVAPSATPERTLHRTGLMQLGEALQDALMQWAIEAAFWHAGVRFSALPLYGVIDLGFDVFTPDGRALPVGLQVRRAHRRPRLGAELPEPGSLEERVKTEVELLLRHYGLTSCNNGTLVEVVQQDGRLSLCYAGRPVENVDQHTLDYVQRVLNVPPDWVGRYHFDGINVQLAREVHDAPVQAQLVDFGHYSHHDKFHFSLLSLVREWPSRWGARVFRHSPQFVQPRDELRMPFERWPGARSWEIAEAFHAGAMDGDAVAAEMFGFLRAVLSRWNTSAASSASAGLRTK